MKKNILFSTTRQWNPGDELILSGIINLLTEVIGDFNSLIYNRSPEVRQIKGYLNPFRTANWSTRSFKNIDFAFRIGSFDNSFKNGMDASFVDYVIFAGTPEWLGRRSSHLYDIAAEFNIPALFLGIGSNNEILFESIKHRYRRVLERAELIVVRDSLTMKILNPLKPVQLACPSLFSSKTEKDISALNKIALIFATDKSVVSNKIDSETFNCIVNLYKTISQLYPCEIVCHYIDELPEAFKLFGDLEINYSYDSKDYLDIYKKFDLVIGPRIHGIGVCASYSIPGILIAHDLRADTAKGLGADIISTDTKGATVVSLIKEIRSNIRACSSSLKDLKADMKARYLELLRKVFYNSIEF